MTTYNSNNYNNSNSNSNSNSVASVDADWGQCVIGIIDTNQEVVHYGSSCKAPVNCEKDIATNGAHHTVRESATSRTESSQPLNSTNTKSTTTKEKDVERGEYSFHFGMTLIDLGKSGKGNDKTIKFLIFGGIIILVVVAVGKCKCTEWTLKSL
jgi:hypothetical protein